MDLAKRLIRMARSTRSVLVVPVRQGRSGRPECALSAADASRLVADELTRIARLRASA